MSLEEKRKMVWEVKNNNRTRINVGLTYSFLWILNRCISAKSTWNQIGFDHYV